MPVPEVGAADAYGHRKKVNVAEFLADELTQRITDVRFLAIDLTYFLRSGEPEVYDKHMAIYYAKPDHERRDQRNLRGNGRLSQRRVHLH